MSLLVAYQSLDAIWMATAGPVRRCHSGDTNFHLFQFGLGSSRHWRTDAIEERFLDTMWRSPGSKVAAFEAGALETWRKDFPRVSGGLRRGLRHEGLFAELVFAGVEEGAFVVSRLGFFSAWSGKEPNLTSRRHRAENPVLIGDPAAVAAVARTARRILPELVDEKFMAELLANGGMPLPHAVIRIDGVAVSTEWEFRERWSQHPMRRKPKGNGIWPR